MRTVKLIDVATFERSSGKVYPAGSILLQISATKGQLHFLDTDQSVEQHYAVISPKQGIEPKYLFYALENFMPEFLSRYQTGLNIQVGVLNHLQISIEADLARQKEWVQQMELVERTMRLSESELFQLKEFKQTLLSDLFV